MNESLEASFRFSQDEGKWREGRGFSGSSIVKNPPASAGHMGSIPDSRRSHMTSEQLRPCAAVTEPVL